MNELHPLPPIPSGGDAQTGGAISSPRPAGLSRSVAEWIGKSPDCAIPPRVKLRIFHRHDGRCAECTRKVGDGQRLRPEYDHMVALINGGEHRESNLRLVCDVCHRGKTATDVAEKSERNRRKVKRNGLRRKRTIPGRRFDGTPIPARWKMRRA